MPARPAPCALDPTPPDRRPAPGLPLPSGAAAALLPDLAPGETRYVTWEDLRALPTTQIALPDEFGKGPRTLRVLFLSDLERALPLLPGADCLLATCKDLYASVYTDAFVKAYRPFLVLELDGKGPKDWPPAGLKYNPAPYAITVSTTLVPLAREVLDLLHKKPWSVVSIEVADYSEKFSGAYSEAWAHLSPDAQAGRAIWINSCASCHPGPNGTFGGSKSGLAFPAVAAIAGYAQPTFRHYVRDPKSVNPTAKMEAHPHYTDAQLDELIAFITAGNAR